jgi:hypothetical protein
MKGEDGGVELSFTSQIGLPRKIYLLRLAFGIFMASPLDIQNL